MSHFTTVRTQINSLDMLKRALTRMGIDCEEGDFMIRQANQESPAELKVDDAVGFKREEDGTFSLVGDPYYSQNPKVTAFYGGSGENRFQKEVNLAYSIEQVCQELALSQFYPVQNREGNVVDGKVHMQFQRA